MYPAVSSAAVYQAETVEVDAADGILWTCRSAQGVLFVVARDPDAPAGYGALPANGGIRIKPYGSDDECAREARALARRMTEKQALYHVGFAGTKITVRADPESVDRPALLAAVGEVLNRLEGAVYTGSDLNVTAADVRLLAGICPYVLAGIGTAVDPSVATAHGVLGALAAAVGAEALPATSFLVHGLGKVGRVVAAELVGAGARVWTVERTAERTRLDGAASLSHLDRWWTRPVDVVVLCSDSYAVDVERARELSCRLVMGSANLPFADHDEVCAVLRERGVLFLPDQLTSAGATICDSIEHYRPAVFRRAAPDDVYDFVRATVRHTTSRVLELSRPRDPRAVDPAVLDEVTRQALRGRRCGDRFVDRAGVRPGPAPPLRHPAMPQPAAS